VTSHRGGVVLVVDDYEDAREIFSTFLQFAGYEVLTAADGQDALDVARGQRPDLILLDLKMPRMDGEAFRREQLADATLSAIPVIVLSASSDGEEIAQRIAAIDYLRKPIDSGMLLTTVGRHLPL
jgi:CheY-like chemotaxis protein